MPSCGLDSWQNTELKLPRMFLVPGNSTRLTGYLVGDGVQFAAEGGTDDFPACSR